MINLGGQRLKIGGNRPLTGLYLQDWCLTSSQFTSMAVFKSLLRRYPWKLQKLLFGFSVAAGCVWRPGTISSLSTESCSKILLAVFKISSRWKASLPSLFRRRRSFSKTLIPFLETDKSLGVRREVSCSVLLTGPRSQRTSSLIASKATFFVTQLSFL